MPDEAMSVEHVARQFGCSAPHVYKMIQEHQLPHFKIGAHIRVLRSAVDAYMHGHGGTPQPQQRKMTAPRKEKSYESQKRKPTQRKAA